MKTKRVTLRREDGFETIVFTKYIFKDEIDYDMSFEDSYIGGHPYKSFFGRLKRAWKAFCDKPVVYTSIYCEDKNKMRKFLTDCLELIDEDDCKYLKDMYKKLEGNKE